MAVDKKRRTSLINTWKPENKDQVIVEKDGKLFICHFDKVFGFVDNLSPYKTFIIGKELIKWFHYLVIDNENRVNCWKLLRA